KLIAHLCALYGIDIIQYVKCMIIILSNVSTLLVIPSTTSCLSSFSASLKFLSDKQVYEIAMIWKHN
ncbi:MAG TPA: hypothetical protein VF985_05870, partial [Mariniflexile sp.]